jgi:hypothetical protein
MNTHTRDSTERPDAYEEYAPRTRPWWVPWLIALLVAALIVGVGSYFVYGRDGDVASMGMGGDEHAIPPVFGYYAGQEIHFLHTEASDPQVAAMLSEMMDSPVIVVRSLADVPDAALGTVFVFQNGVKPEGDRGPFGFQPDVFDSVPGDPGYTPLRSVNLATWKEDAEPRVLRTAEEVHEAESAGELSIARPGIVVNMPIVRWPTGSR